MKKIYIVPALKAHVISTRNHILTVSGSVSDGLDNQGGATDEGEDMTVKEESVWGFSE